MAGKNDEIGLFCNRTSPAYNLSQQGYANVLHNQRLSETASPCILRGRVKIKQMCQILTTFLLQPLLQLISKKTNPNKVLMKPLKTSLFMRSYAIKE